MPVRLTQTREGGGIYFITSTCYDWKPLFEQAKAYNVVNGTEATVYQKLVRVEDGVVSD